MTVLAKDKKVYIAGHTGLVGVGLVRYFSHQGFTNLIVRSHQELDLQDRLAVDGFFQAEQPDVVVLAVKPQMLHEVAPSLATHLADKLVLSVLAGVPSAVLSNTLACNQVVRAMPNLPAAIGQGATGLYADKNVNQTSQDVCTAIMSSCGLVAWVHDEAHLHAVTAVAGSARCRCPSRFARR